MNTSAANHNESLGELLGNLSDAVIELQRKSRGEQFDHTTLTILGTFLALFAGNIEGQDQRIVKELQRAMNLLDARERIKTESDRLLSDTFDVGETLESINFCKTLIEVIRKFQD